VDLTPQTAWLTWLTLVSSLSRQRLRRFAPNKRSGIFIVRTQF
jgi:hypothetical protein